VYHVILHREPEVKTNTPKEVTDVGFMAEHTLLSHPNLRPGTKESIAMD